MADPQAAPVSVEDLIRKEAARQGIPASYALAIAETESGPDFNPTALGQPVKEGPAKGQQAIGTFQLLPSTAQGLLDPSTGKPIDPYNAKQNIVGGVTLLKQLFDQHQGNYEAIAKSYGGVVHDQTYIPKVLDIFNRRHQAEKAGTPYTPLARTPAPATPPAAPAPAQGTGLFGYTSNLPPDIAAQLAATRKGEKPPSSPVAVVTGPPPAPGVPRQARAGAGKYERSVTMPADVAAQLAAIRANPSAPAPSTPTVTTEGPIAAVAKGFDPTTYQGRQAIAGTTGGIVGGTLAAPSGPFTMGAGPYLGAMGGAATLAMIEHGIEEYLGTAPPDPNHGVVARTGAAGLEQALYEGTGQALGKVVNVAGKRVIQSNVSRYAADYLKKAREGSIEALYNSADGLNALRATERATKLQQAADREKLTNLVLGRNATAAQAARDAFNAAKGQAGVDKTVAQAARDQAVAQAEGVLDPYLANPPSAALAGEQVNKVFEGPADISRKKLGEAVEAAAETGPDLDIRAVKDEARRIGVKELLPPSLVFNRNRLTAVQQALKGVVGEPPPGLPGVVSHVFPEGLTSADDLFKHVLADAQAQGYTGSAKELRAIFDEHLQGAQGLISELVSADAQRGSGKSLLQKIKEYGGLGADKGFQGELDDLWTSSSAYKAGKGWAQGANRLARGRFVSKTGGFQGVTGVLKREGGTTLDDMAMQLRQDPQFAHITGPSELLDALNEAIHPDTKGAKIPSLGTALEQQGVKPGTPWWQAHEDFDPIKLEAQATEEEKARAVEALTQRANDARLQEQVKNPVIGLLGDILGAPDTVPFKIAHQWKSQLQQALAASGSYDAVVKTQATNIAQHMAEVMRKALKVHEPYNQATAEYAQVAKLFTEGHAPLIKQTAIDNPGAVIAALKVDNPTAAKMLVDVLTTHAEAGGGKAQGREALDAVQAAWAHRNILKDGVAKIGDNLADLDHNPEFRDALFGDPGGRAYLDNIRQIAAVNKRAVAEAEVELAQRQAAGELNIQRARETGMEAASNVRAQGKAQQQALTQSQRQARAAQTTDIQAKLDEIRRTKATATPEEEAFLRSTIAPKVVREPQQVAADFMHSMLRAHTYFGALGMARLVKGASDADLLAYVAHSPMLTQMFVKNVATGLRPGWAIAAYRRGVARPAPTRVATPPPPPPTAEHPQNEAR